MTNFSSSRLPTVALALLLTASACRDDDDPAPVTVLVEDDGMDPSLPAFRDVVVASYTLVCASTGDDDSAFPDPFAQGSAPADGGFELTPRDAQADEGGSDAGVNERAPADVKAALLAHLSMSDESCTLRRGLDPVAAPLADLEDRRRDWNTKVRDDVSVVDDPLLNTIGARVGQGQFHGTSTAGIVAYDNPSVRLVLVNRKLANAQDIAAMIRCPRQRDLDDAAQLLADPDVVQAYATRPLGSDERAFAQTIAEHGVSIVNESFGSLSRHGLDELLQLAHCPAVSLDGYFVALNELQHRDHLRASVDHVLIVRAAGNEGARLDGPQDALDCRDDEPTVSFVGSYGLTGEKSSFTNFGACVDVFAPGEAVLAPVPGDWWYPQFGTSFAAPLVTRLASMLPVASRGFDALAARNALHAMLRPDRSIPRPRFPEELLYVPGLKTPLALTIETQASVRVAPAELRRVLGPLRIVQRFAR